MASHALASGLIEYASPLSKGKAHRPPFPKKSTSRASGVLDLVHSDVCGPMPVESVGGARYYVGFTHDFSRWSDVFCTKRKSDVLACFIRWQGVESAMISQIINYGSNAMDSTFQT
jgi:hypothetical protein